jgi:hypothetical protein
MDDFDALEQVPSFLEEADDEELLDMPAEFIFGAASFTEL